MSAPVTVDEYIAGFPPEIAERLHRIRAEIVDAVTDAAGTAPQEKIRYGMPAVMLDGHYALHFAGWKKHIGLYPVPVLPEPLESEIAARRSSKDSVVFPHTQDVPYDLIGRVAREIADHRVGPT